MEGKEIKFVYFIYSQKGENNNILVIELNDKIKSIKEIIKKDWYDSIIILYRIEVLKSKNENKINISLIDNKGDVYFSHILFNYLESLDEENFDMKDNIIFKLKFNNYNNEGNNLNQVILPYNEQFELFSETFKDNDKIMINLYLSTISQIFLKTNEKCDFIFDFFLKIYDKQKMKSLPKLKQVIKYFFKNIKYILRNCELVEKLEISQETLKVLNDIDKIRTDLNKIVQEEENIDIFLAYYYVHYQKKLFIEFINNAKYKNEINKNLNNNRNIFNNFTNEIITSDLMDEAANSEELLSLIKLYPNIVECFKILTNYNIYCKFISFKQIEKKNITITKFQEPKITDDLDLLKIYFEIVYNIFLEETVYPLNITEDFFNKYYQIFEKNDEDFHNILIIIDMLYLYNSKSANKITSEYISKSFYEKGLFFIRNKKLKNYDLIKFIKYYPNLLKTNQEFIDNFHYGIEFNEKYKNNKEFMNEILNNENNENFNLKEYLGQYNYFYIFEKIFEKFVIPKDLVVLRAWEINDETPEEIIEIFLKTIKRVWINYPENNMFGLWDLFANEFSYASQKVDNYKYYLNLIEEKIDKEKIMVIYSLLLIKKYNISEEFKKHMINYIRNNNKITARYIWFLTSTFEDHYSKINNLKKYLENDGSNYIVKYSDYVHYPQIVADTIDLFIYLKNNDIIPQYFKDTEYYIFSMMSKKYLEQNTFNDSVIIGSNIEKIQELLENVFSEENNSEIDDSIIITLNFMDKLEAAKNYHDSLKKVLNYLEIFFIKDKSNDINKLRNIIIKFERKQLVCCVKEIESKNYFIDMLPRAEEGLKLKGSKIFMELWDKYQTIKDEEKRFNQCMNKFNELEKLGINCNFDSLDEEMKEIIINSIYKNNNLLNEELNFIKNYFNFDKNNKKNFNIRSLRNSINALVRNQQNKQGSYVINLQEIFQMDKEANELEFDDIINEQEDDNNDFHILDFDYNKISDNKIKNNFDNEISKLKNEINLLYDLLLYNSKIFENSIYNKDLENYYNSLSKFYIKLFTSTFGIAKLSLEDIYLQIILVSDKIFYLSKNLGVLDNSKMSNYRDEFILISEFNFLIHIIKLYEKISKKNYIKIFNIFNKLYNNNCINNVLDINDINSLFEVLEDNIPKYNLNDNYIEIFEYELKLKEERGKKEIIKYMLDNKFSFLYSDLIPLMDIIFAKEIKNKLKFDNQKDDDYYNYFKFDSIIFGEINKIFGNNNDILSEMLLFYFENKIMKEIYKKNLKEENFFENANIRDNFIKCLEFLEKEYNKKNYILSVLFSIAFIKCFLYKLIKYVMDEPEHLKIDEIIFKYAIKFEDENCSPYRKSLQLYILKLLFHYSGNLHNYLNLKLNALHIDDSKIKEKIYIENYKNYGLNSLLIPIKSNEDNKTYKIIILKIFQLKSMEIIIDQEINQAINNNIDLLFCVIANFHFSFYYDKDYFNTNEYNEIQIWFESIVDQIDILENNYLYKSIFKFFLHLKNKDCVYKKYILFNYDQILCLLISARFVLNIIYSENRENLFYNLIINAEYTINNNPIFFKEYYLRDFDINIIDNRKINCLTYKIINFITLSHIFFGFISQKIATKEIKNIFKLDNNKNENDKEIYDYLLDNLFKEFDFIKNILVPLLGINDIIIFMNNIYKEIIPELIEIRSDNNKENFNKQEQYIDEIINKLILNYKESVDDYYKFEDKAYQNKMQNDSTSIKKNNDLINIFFEKPEFYKNKESLEKNYPLLSYLTYTNFSSLNNDFINQYQYYYFDRYNYPFISIIAENNVIFDIINFITKLNQFTNKVYDKLNMRYSEEDINNKKIKEIFNDELKEDINNFNDFIEKNNKLFDINNKITEDNKLRDIINIPGSIINLIYTEIINIYNEFLNKMKIAKDNKDNISNVIIQEAGENDYNFNYELINDKKITIKEELDELILLYSKRERKKEDYINIYDGGKIIYNFEMIENKLEDKFIFGKSFFSFKQKLFIFNEDIFKIEENILNQIEKKFIQKKINEENNLKIEAELNKLSEGNKLNIFYELLSLLYNLIQNEFDLKITNDEKGFDDIIKYLELKSYKYPHLKEIKKSLKNIISINYLLYLYEEVKNKVFIKLTPGFKQKIINEDFYLDDNAQNEIEECLGANKIIKKDFLIKAMKKYILRYIKNQKEFLFNFHDLKRKEIWDIGIYNSKDFNSDFDKLLLVNSNKNCGNNLVVKYFYLLIYEIDINIKKSFNFGFGDEQNKNNSDDEDLND